MTKAIFAADPTHSRGRRFPEPLSPTRSDFRRDSDRVIHSSAFRRLAYKTQVFVFYEGDHYRSRLTHTLEVQQIARSLARALNLDEDLAEALALAHDLGHPPFGHAGERALDKCLSAFGGFDHNAQTLRVVTALERRYPTFDGLNLTWETLEGLIKHNGPLTDRSGMLLGRYHKRGISETILELARSHDIQLSSFASAEAQVAAISDDIAYDAHDIDDGLRGELFALQEIDQVPIIGRILGEADSQYPNLDRSRRVHELLRRLITRMIEDVIAETGRRTAALGPKSVDEVRSAPSSIVGFSLEMAQTDCEIKNFLNKHMYWHERITRIVTNAEGVIQDLFSHYMDYPDDMPSDWAEELCVGEDAARARRIADFIAGMTDRFALAEHERLFDSTPELR